MTNKQEYASLLKKQQKCDFMKVLRSMNDDEWFYFVVDDVIPERLQSEYDRTKPEYDRLQGLLDTNNDNFIKELCLN